MRPENQFIKKKKKKKNRFARFVVFLVLFIIIISLAFYSISNPSFIKNIRDSIISFYTPDSEDGGGSNEEAAEQSNTPDSASEGNQAPEDNSGAESPETTITTTAAQEAGADSGQAAQSGVFTVFWQKILSLLKIGPDADKNSMPSRLNIKVYFASLGEEKKFTYEERSIIAGDPQIALKSAVEELLRGPVKSFHYPVIPPGTKILDIEIYENLAKINFSQDFLENSLESGILDEYVIYTIVNTVTQVPGIEGVIFLIDGKRIKVYGNVDLSIPAIMDESYLEEES